MAMVALMTGQVAQALRLSSIGAVFNNAAALEDPANHMTPGLVHLGQVANYDDGDAVFDNALAQSGILDVDWEKEGKNDQEIKKTELKTKEAELKRKEMEIKADKMEQKAEAAKD